MSTAVVFTALFIPSFLGQEELNIVSAAEVRASEEFYYHARHGSVLLLAAPGFPYRYGATYSDFSGPEGDANPNLMTSRLFEGQQLGAVDVPAIIARIMGYAKHGYLAFTKDETAYAQVEGITPPGALGHLEAAVARSPDFRLWYGNTDAQIYELVEAHVTGRERRHSEHAPGRAFRASRATNSTLSTRLAQPDLARHDIDGENPALAWLSGILRSDMPGNRPKALARQSTTNRDRQHKHRIAHRGRRRRDSQSRIGSPWLRAHCRQARWR